MTQFDIYAFDCGTTNWRIYRLHGEHGDDDAPPRSLSDPQRVALSTFAGAYLPAAVLLNEQGQVQSYGANAYEQARDPELRPLLRDAFKLCLGHRQAVEPLDPCRRYTHPEALTYTRLLLEPVVAQLEREKPGSLKSENRFYFAHPVHWGRERDDGRLEGEILPDFAAKVRDCFPAGIQESVHFVTEPEAALASLTQLGQLHDLGQKLTLVVDAGGGTTDFVAGHWTGAGLQGVRTYGEALGGERFDSDLANYVAEVLQVPLERCEEAWAELRYYGRQLKENLSRQMRMDATVPVTMKILLEIAPERVLSQRLQFRQADFEARTRETAHAFERLVLRALVQMDLRKSDIGQVVLVGGGANLYLVPPLLQGLFGKTVPVVYGDPPEETIARGATLWPMRDKSIPEPVPPPEPVPVEPVLREPGTVFRDPLKDGSQGPEMVVIPAGRFRMGDPQGLGGADEKPVHTVTFSKPFALGQYPVMFEEYDRFAQATNRERPYDQGWGRGHRPVINVSWEEAVAYTEWLSNQTGKPYRLPTEAEWEYAARGGTETAYWWGNEIGRNRANCDGCGSQWDNKQTSPVGSFEPNSFGLYDMLGNVWEWVQDCWNENYAGAPTDGSAWLSGDCSYRVIRGGSWYYRPRNLRVSDRGRDRPGNRCDYQGFRLAQDL